MSPIRNSDCTKEVSAALVGVAGTEDEEEGVEALLDVWTSKLVL
jgi:hypothetical protein